MGEFGGGRYVSNKTGDEGTLVLNVKVATDSVRVSFRGYMIVKDDATGEQATYYTDIKSGTYGELNQ